MAGKSAANTEIEDNPPPDEFADVKPHLSAQEQAALADDDDEDGAEVAGGGEKDSDAENSMASPTAEDQSTDPNAAPSNTTDDEGDDDPAPPGTPPAKQMGEPEIERGFQQRTEIRATRQFEADIVGKIAGVDTQIDALEQQLDDGDIEIAVFMRETRKLNNTRQELVADQREQVILRNANQALVETDWNTSVASFMAANTQFQNPIMTGAFQAALNGLYADADNHGSSHNWYLQTAKRAVLEQITPAEAALDTPPDNAGTPQQVAAKNIQDKGKTRAQKAAKDRAAVPQTLAGASASLDNPGGEDEFSSLDALEGIELENALAKMTDTQQDRYLRAGL